MSFPPIVDFPEIRSPFKRVVNEREEYIVTPELEEGFEWIFEEGVRSMAKLRRDMFDWYQGPRHKE